MRSRLFKLILLSGSESVAETDSRHRKGAELGKDRGDSTPKNKTTIKGLIAIANICCKSHRTGANPHELIITTCTDGKIGNTGTYFEVVFCAIKVICGEWYKS